jgi:hypothetical protein
MKIRNLRQEGVNSMTVEIDGQKFRIISNDEISRRDAAKGIPESLNQAESLEEARGNLGHYSAELVPAT